MDRIYIPDRLDPSSRIGDATPEDRSGKKPQGRGKKVKVQIPATPEASPDPDDESHQLDEHA